MDKRKAATRPDRSLIMGKNCIKEVLRSAPERFELVYVSNSEDPLSVQLQKASVPIRLTSKGQLSEIVQSDSHQGFIARVKPRREFELKEFLSLTDDMERSVVVMLDSINDPQNLGAILRAAECFGADAVVWSKNRGVDLTPVVAKASVGASELLRVIKVSNLADSVKKFQERGYEVISAEVGEGAVSLSDHKFSDKTVLIMGSEGKGVQNLLGKLADHRVYIPMMGQIDSLNVSQATAVLLSWVRNC